jgi:hypothetical protein
MFLILNLLILSSRITLSFESIAMLLLFALLIGFMLKNLIAYFWLIKYVYSLYFEFDFLNFINFIILYSNNVYGLSFIF